MTLSFVGLTTGTPFRTFRRGNVMGRARRKLTTLASGGDETSKKSERRRGRRRSDARVEWLDLVLRIFLGVVVLK